MIHQYLAAIFCTTGLVLLSLESIKNVKSFCDWQFSITYSVAMLGWILLGWMTNSASLVIIAVVQLTAAAALLLCPARQSTTKEPK